MTAHMQILERVVCRAPFGLRLWDVATETDLVDGLEVTIELEADPTSFARATVNRRGIYVGAGLPGLRTFELGDTDIARLRRYLVRVTDPEGRFLPLRFAADLPAQGLFTCLSDASPPEPFTLPTEHGSPIPLMTERVPLFSAPGRPAPGALAAIRAQLVELGTERPAAWAIVTATIDGLVRGIGLADEIGRVTVLFPYPDRARPTLTSPPQATNEFRWNVELIAYYAGLPGAPPDLRDVLKQLSSPRTLFQSITSPPQSLPALPLEYRTPLTVRTEITPSGPSSFLYVNVT